MIVELRGVEFVNKGAELMLHAILSELRKHDSNVKVVMRPTPRTPKDKLRAVNIYIRIRPSRHPLKKALKKFIPSQFYALLGYVRDEEIKVVLDASGFAFGDQWGAKYAEDQLGKHIVEWKKRNKKVILLPQAFGGFHDDELRKVMVKIIDYADLIFAREPRSFDYLREISNTPKIKLAPDFTNLINGKVPTNLDTSLEVAIIPNYKMLEATQYEKNEYFSFLRNAVTNVRQQGFNPFFLIHEGQKDFKLTDEANQELKSPIPIIHNPDPLVIKGIIGQTKFIICSRFHGVVSALCQGVPPIVAGWSHKYELLLTDYNQSNLLIRDISDKDELHKAVKMLSHEQTRTAISNEIKQHAVIQKELSKAMWQTVFNEIKS
ncbi:polysaccharide pyruvyl transferase family protein [Parapedobacter koreensis]|uniref:Colanic acid/amylovoran biosynthesis protein n=1 Tax=Parapedobacter koreensis TaxID=332977 RepID=A0A1H7T7Q6_9SPHI|nr:polysaccharide pyruvyl transferase family protein [Parapedobacter koreensis]SEL80394.1 colanic acid/amylovoran biosynthesis protein [Parapedobacter koreensis]